MRSTSETFSPPTTRKRRTARAFPLILACSLLILFQLLPSGCGQKAPEPATGPDTRPSPDISRLKSEISKYVSIAAAGDVNFGDGVTPYLSANGVDYPWSDAATIFSQADETFVNLECCIASGGTPVAGKEYCFRGPVDSAAGLKRAGVDVVSLANNHSKDYGTAAFVETLGHLRENGVAWCGAGMNESEAYQPTVLTSHGRKVGYVAFTSIVPEGWPATSSSPGCATTWNPQQVAETIKRAKASCDYVVASFHWGVELATSPSAEQRQLAHLAIDSGADLVLGHHPHVVQGFEVYRNRLIAYSLGNFVFSPPREISAKTVSTIAVLGPDGLAQAKIVPMVISGGRPILLSGNEADAWLATVAGYSREFATDVSIRDGKGFIDGNSAPAGGATGPAN